MRRRRRDSGVVSIEFLGGTLFVLVAVLIGLQALLAMFALSQSNSAARNAARSEVLAAGSGPGAGVAALSAPLQRDASVSCMRGPSITCRATVSMPVFGIDWLAERTPALAVTRTATLPDTEPGL